MSAQQQGQRLFQQLSFFGRNLGNRCQHVGLSCSAGLGPSTSYSSGNLWVAGSRGLAAGRQQSPYRRLKALLLDYKKLSKFRLSALVALTASAGFAAGSEDSIDFSKLAWTSVGTFGAAACANALNQLYEIANDGRMARTCNRPLPAGRISSRHAMMFALLSGAAGLCTLHAQVSKDEPRLQHSVHLTVCPIESFAKAGTSLHCVGSCSSGATPALPNCLQDGLTGLLDTTWSCRYRS